MSKDRTIFAHTEPSGTTAPAYVNITYTNGGYRLSVRTAGESETPSFIFLTSKDFSALVASGSNETFEDS